MSRRVRSLRAAFGVVLALVALGLAPVAARAADPVLVGAGDIAVCGGAQDEATAALLDGIDGTIMTLGDAAYLSGTLSEYVNCFGPTWGRHKARIRPAPSDHDYETPGAAGYYDYFGAAAGTRGLGYYSYDLGSWHVMVLNSNCSDVPGGCGSTSPQVQWLRQDLAASAHECTVAYWHSPRWTSGTKHGNDPRVAEFWNALYDFGAELVLSGNEHNYERFAPQTPDGQLDVDFGIRQIVSGTGGRGHYSLTNVRPNSEVRNTTAFGVTKLTLHADSYDWQFVPVAGQTFTDSGTTACHGPRTDPPPPPPPTTTTTAPPAPPTNSFLPVADARVEQANPTANFGSASTLRVDNSPYSESYLRFDPSGLSGTVVDARLRFFATNGSGNGPKVFPTTNGWGETTINFNNRPGSVGAMVDDVGSVGSNAVAEWNVTEIVRGTLNDEVSFRLVPDSNDGLEGASREASSNRPVLVVTTGAPATPSTSAISPHPDGGGYWTVRTDGKVAAFGAGTGHFGDASGLALTRPVTGIAATPTGKGYYLVDPAGKVFAFGDAIHQGDMSTTPLNRPVVGIAAARTGMGYWLVASDGGVFAFGSAGFAGSTGHLTLNRPIVGMAADPDGAGYWMVASDGGVFAFSAEFSGSTGSLTLNRPVIGMAPTADGRGYWLVASDGGVFAFDAPFHGSTGSDPPDQPVVGLAARPAGDGYWMVTAGGEVFDFGAAPDLMP